MFNYYFHFPTIMSKRIVCCSTYHLVLCIATLLLVSIWALFIIIIYLDSSKVTSNQFLQFFQGRSDKYDAYAQKHNIFAYSLSSDEYHNQIPGLVYKHETKTINGTKLFKLEELISNWKPNDVSPLKWMESLAHPQKGNSVIRLNYSLLEDLEQAVALRNLEQPFILYDVKQIDIAAKNYFSIQNLIKQFGRQSLRIEQSSTTEFLYYKPPNMNHLRKSNPLKDWKPPQTEILMNIKQYLKLVEEAESLGNVIESNTTLYYFTLSAGEGYSLPWLREALPMFKPEPSLFIVDPSGFRGINCRFGMKGVIATAHYDGGRNFVAMIRGRKRYILLPPESCADLYLLPRGHPSARHSKSNWADIEELKNKYPKILNSSATEVMLSAGEVLYIPGYWFHYIVSQDSSIQCNARSGDSKIGREAITNCGFYDG